MHARIVYKFQILRKNFKGKFSRENFKGIFKEFSIRKSHLSNDTSAISAHIVPLELQHRRQGSEVFRGRGHPYSLSSSPSSTIFSFFGSEIKFKKFIVAPWELNDHRGYFKKKFIYDVVEGLGFGKWFKMLYLHILLFPLALGAATLLEC
jgi:hypothetical protein